MKAYSVNFVYDPSDQIDISKTQGSGDTVMKDVSGKRQVKKANSWALTKSGKGSDLSGGSNSTGNSTNNLSSGGMLDSDEKKRERANSNSDTKNFSQVMIERWQRSNQGIPIMD